jgi:hypothetical protein
MARPPSKPSTEPEEFDLESATSRPAEPEEFDLESATGATAMSEAEEVDLEAATRTPGPPARPPLPSLPLLPVPPPAPPTRASVTNEVARSSRSGEEFDLDLAHLPAEERAELEEKAAVEAAIASLEGRDPTRAMGDLLARRERDRFEGQVKSAVKNAKASQEQAAERSRRRLPYVILGVAAIAAVGIVAYVKVSSNLDALAKQRELTGNAAAPFAARGFVEHELGPEGELVVAGEPQRCFVAVVGASGDGARLRVERDGFAVEGREVAWCSCGTSAATVRRLAPDGAAIAVYAAPSEKVGGAAFLEALDPRTAERLGEQGGGGCVEALLDRYVASTPVGQAVERADPRHAALVGAGLSLVGGASEDDRFVSLPAKAKTCLVVDGADADEALVLRLAGGEAPLVESPVVALCQDRPVQASVWRRGKGKLSVYATSLESVGGSVGLGEVLARAGAPGAPVHRTAEVIAEEPATLLAASGILSAHVVEGSGRSRLGLPDPPHLFAFAKPDGGYASKISTTRGAIACRPDLSTRPASAICVGAAGVFDGLEGPRAERPAWLPASTDPQALARYLDALALARRLRLAGFELTTVDGVVETPTGATITGRADEKQVVAIALSAAPPFLHTLSDKEAWKVDGEPRLVPVSPGGQVSLVASPAFAGPRVPRSMIVFRR